MFARSRSIAVFTALVVVSGSAGATAATRGEAAESSSPKAAPAKTMSVRKARSTGPVRPVKVGGSTVVAITAFPTGDKGTGTEATCGLWADRLQEDMDAQDTATEKQDVIDATNNLNEDIDNALDAGCVVIYSAAASPQLTKLTSVALSRVAQRGWAGTMTTMWTPSPQAVAITAFPTGGKGSGTEATCALWTERLEADQRIIDNAPEADKDDASGPLEEDIDNALDAGCAVIH